MALTRKMLKAMSVEDEKIDQIIEAHTETVEALKKERDGYKEDADKLTTVEAELDKLKKEHGDPDDWKEKYEKEHKDFEDYKANVTEKETKAAKKEAYTALLKEAGVSDKRIGAVLKVSDIDALKLDKEGKLVDADKLTEAIKTEWADFIVTTHEKGANTAKPPDDRTYSAEVTVSRRNLLHHRSARAVSPHVLQ